MIKLNKVTILSTVAAAALLTGCASTKQLDEVRAIAEAAKAEAAAATQAAQNAEMKSGEAMQSAEDANSKIDNMFKKAMQK